MGRGRDELLDANLFTRAIGPCGRRREGVFAGRNWPFLCVLEMKQRVTVEKDVLDTFMDVRYTPASVSTSR